jgi:hypothetical protein
VREGNDLVHTARISLADALTGCIVELLMLDDRTLNIPVSDVVCPGYSLRIRGEGMPITKGGKGDLVRFASLHFNSLYFASLNFTVHTIFLFLLSCFFSACQRLFSLSNMLANSFMLAPLNSRALHDAGAQIRRCIPHKSL